VSHSLSVPLSELHLGPFDGLQRCRSLSQFEEWLGCWLLPLFKADSGLVYELDDKTKKPRRFLSLVHISQESEILWSRLIARDPLEHLLCVDNGKAAVAYDLDLPRTNLAEIILHLNETCADIQGIDTLNLLKTGMVAILLDEPPVRLRLNRFASPSFLRHHVAAMTVLAPLCGLSLRSLLLEEELYCYHSLSNYLFAALPAAALVTPTGRVLQCNEAFSKICAADRLTHELQLCMDDPAIDTVKIDGQPFWVKCHELSCHYRLVLLDARVQEPPLWTRVSWPASLSSRERCICVLVLEGLDNETIAKRLCISYHTVKNHMRHIYEKVGVTNRIELVLALLGLHC